MLPWEGEGRSKGGGVREGGKEVGGERRMVAIFHKMEDITFLVE